MENLFSAGFLLSTFLIIVATIKKVDLAKKVGLFFLTILTLLFYTQHGVKDGSSHSDLFLISSLFLTTSYSLSFLRKIPAVLRWLLPIAFVGLFALVSNPLKIDEYVVNFSASSLWLFIGLAYILAPLSELKALYSTKLFGVSELQAQRAFSPLFFGFALFVTTFFYSSTGIFIMALGIASWVFANNGRNNFLLPVLALLFAQSFVMQSDLGSIDVLLGKNLEALFFGLCAVLLTNVFVSATKRVVFSQLFSLLLASGLSLFLLVLGTQKADFGGQDSYIVFLVGMALSFFAVRENAWNASLFGGVVSVGLFFMNALYPLAEPAVPGEKVVTVVAKEESAIDEQFEAAPTNSIESLSGKYKINQEKFELVFELGPKGGRTKGKFKQIEGTVRLNGENSVFEITLPAKGLTTMNMYRDESLYGETYFNVEKFTTMSYKATKLVKVDNNYELHGEFTMLGKTQKQQCELKYIGQSATGLPVLCGRGKIDRTQFGMTPDPKEGNVVDFYFEVELIKN